MFLSVAELGHVHPRLSNLHSHPINSVVTDIISRSEIRLPGDLVSSRNLGLDLAAGCAMNVLASQYPLPSLGKISKHGIRWLFFIDKAVDLPKVAIENHILI